MGGSCGRIHLPGYRGASPGRSYDVLVFRLPACQHVFNPHSLCQQLECGWGSASEKCSSQQQRRPSQQRYARSTGLLVGVGV
eukprot:scaffold183212_cov33-Tisochrysis_lutea.AAC.5